MRYFRLITIAMLLALWISPLYPQPVPQEARFSADRRLFSVDVLSSPSDSTGLSRVDIYLEIPYEGLQFLKTADFFRAAFEITADVYDLGNTLVTEKFWREQLTVASIDEVSTLKPGEIMVKTLLLPPGRYFFNVQVKDTETGRSSTSRLEVTVTDFSAASWVLSDPMLVRAYEEVDGKKVITPNIPGTVSDATDSFFVYLKLFNGLGMDSMRLITDVIGKAATVVRSDTQTLGIGSAENTLIPSVRCRSLPLGDYTLRFYAYPLGDLSSAAMSDTAAAVTDRTFRIRWVGSPIAIEDLDRAIDQMQYILERDQLEEMKELPGIEKRNAWLDYWKRKDPTPGTDRNELMEEYYARVDYANKHFSHYTEGWKTDMGMVYIIFGMPSNIERHPFEIDSKPYEVWTYYESNRQFVFVDATGFGDYRLQTPIWDVYQTRPR